MNRVHRYAGAHNRMLQNVPPAWCLSIMNEFHPIPGLKWDGIM